MLHRLCHARKAVRPGRVIKERAGPTKSYAGGNCGRGVCAPRYVRSSRAGRRVRNTTKCDMVKLTKKLARIAAPLAASSGMNLAAMTRVVVLAMAPSRPDARKVPYDFQRNCRPDSAAKVMCEFMT